jgi:hypothetical protein
MSIEKLQQDILRCKHIVSEIHTKMYDPEGYREIVDGIFKEIFKDYLHESGKIKGLHAENQCPDKLEPREGYLPKEGLRIIRKRLNIEDN